MRPGGRNFYLSVPRLLVSVRNVEEAKDAVLGGADIVDVKEPRRGSLGAADRKVVERVLLHVGTQYPVSMAAGELLDQATVKETDGVRFVKFGLAGCAHDDQWQWKLKQTQDCLSIETQLVPVAYADWQAAEAPQPSEVLHCAETLGCQFLLVDTFNKRGGGLFECWNLAAVRAFVQSAQAIGMAVALAGGLREEGLIQAVETGADVIGVRGAVCDAGRTGRLQRDRVEFVHGIVKAGISSRLARAT